MNYDFSPKIDWLQYSVLKTFPDQKNDCLSSKELHELKLCDFFIGTLFNNVDHKYDYVLFPLMQEFIDTFIFKELRFKLKKDSVITMVKQYIPGYQFVVDVDSKFKILVPLRKQLESDVENNVFPLIRGRNFVSDCGDVISDWFVYNEFVGLSIVFSGSQISRKIDKLSFDDFMTTQKKLHLDFKIQRLDLAMDSNIDFSVVYRKLYNNRGLRLPHINHKSIRYDVNPNDNSGSIIAGKRGSTRYMRIYNKFAEQNGSSEHYPFDVKWATVRSINDKLNVECFPWTRLEFELRDTAAMDAMFYFLDPSVASNLYEYFSTHFMLYSIIDDQDLKYFIHYIWDRLSLDPSYVDFCQQNKYFVQSEEIPCHRDFNPQALSNRYFRTMNSYKVSRSVMSTLYTSSLLFGIDLNTFMQSAGTVTNQSKIYRKVLENMGPDAFLSVVDSKLLQSVQRVNQQASELAYQALTAKGISSVISGLCDDFTQFRSEECASSFYFEDIDELFDLQVEDPVYYDRFKSFVSERIKE